MNSSCLSTPQETQWSTWGSGDGGEGRGGVTTELSRGKLDFVQNYWIHLFSASHKEPKQHDRKKHCWMGTHFPIAIKWIFFWFCLLKLGPLCNPKVKHIASNSVQVCKLHKKLPTDQSPKQTSISGRRSWSPIPFIFVRSLATRKTTTLSIGTWWDYQYRRAQQILACLMGRIHVAGSSYFQTKVR